MRIGDTLKPDKGRQADRVGAGDSAGVRLRRATLRDVASEAGVSLMTVSRVVRGVQSVAACTVQRVEDAIARTGYSPDPMLSALAAYRTPEGGQGGGQIAFIDCDGTEYSTQVLAGVREQAQLHGYTVEVCTAGQSMVQNRRLSRMLYHRGVRGLLFGPSDSPRVLDGWDWKHFASVSLAALAHQPQLHAVSMDYFDGAYSGFHTLHALGCRRIAHLVLPQFEQRTGNRWLGGYCAALASVRGAQMLRWERSDWRGLAQWLRANAVDGVLTIHSEAAGVAASLGAARARKGRAAAQSEPVSTQPPLTKIAFLNEALPEHAAPCHYYSAIAPQTIGAEGLRMMHHLLLRSEFGLPLRPRMLAVRGCWKQAPAAL